MLKELHISSKVSNGMEFKKLNIPHFPRFVSEGCRSCQLIGQLSLVAAPKKMANQNFEGCF